MEHSPLEIARAERPLPKDGAIGREVPLVGDPPIAPEWHVELPLSVEPTETVVPGAVEKVEQGRGLAAARSAFREQLVESSAVPVEDLGVVLERLVDPEASFQPPVEVDQVRVDVIQQGAL